MLFLEGVHEVPQKVRRPQVQRASPSHPPGKADSGQVGTAGMVPPAPPPDHPRLPTAVSQMVISFYYGGKLVGQTTTTCSEGCRLSLGQPGPLGGKLYGPEGLELGTISTSHFILPSFSPSILAGSLLPAAFPPQSAFK